MKISSKTVQQSLFGGKDLSQSEVRELLARLVENKSSSGDAAFCSALDSLFISWKKNAQHRILGNAACEAWLKAAVRSTEVFETMKPYNVSVTELRAYVGELYEHSEARLRISGPESLLQSVLDSFISDPKMADQILMKDSADILPLLIGIAKRKLNSRKIASDPKVTANPDSMESTDSNSAAFVDILRGLCERLWSMLTSDEERIVAKYCFQRFSIDDVVRTSKQSAEIVEMHIQQLRTYVSQLGLSGA